MFPLLGSANCGRNWNYCSYNTIILYPDNLSYLVRQEAILFVSDLVLVQIIENSTTAYYSTTPAFSS
jgi:hypothetical protein